MEDPQASAPRSKEPAGTLVEAMLSEYGSYTREAIRSFMPKGEPHKYLYRLLEDYPSRRGKMMRSSLCIAAAKATGGSLEDALPTAVSIELMHNALLVHDDIEDDSDERRGTPTLHALHGVPLAINAGDAMGLMCVKPLFENFSRLGVSTSLRLLQETERVAWQSAEGQALELGWQRDNSTDLGDEDYFGMVLQKTCWLGTIHPLRSGCLVGSRGRLSLDPLIRIGFLFGAAFQIQDDVLNLRPGPGYGKEVNGDLFEGKRTLMVIHALRTARATDRRRLVRLLGLPRRRRDASQVGFLRDVLDRTGAVDYALAVAGGLAGAAIREFDDFFAALPASRDRDFIRATLIWVLQRTR